MQGFMYLTHSIITRFMIFFCVINLPFNAHFSAYWSSFPILSQQVVDLWFSQPLMCPLQIKITNWKSGTEHRPPCQPNYCTCSGITSHLSLLYHPSLSLIYACCVLGLLHAQAASLLQSCPTNIDSRKPSESWSSYHQPDLATSFRCWLPATLRLYHHHICTVHPPHFIMGNLPLPTESWIH